MLFGEDRVSKKTKILILSNYYCDRNDPWYRIRFLTAQELAKNDNYEVTIISPAKDGVSFNNKVTENLTEICTPGFFPPGVRRGGFSMSDLFVKSWHVLTNKYDVIHTDLSHRPAAIFPSLVGKWFRGSIIICELWEWFGRGGIADTRGTGIQKMISR